MFFLNESTNIKLNTHPALSDRLVFTRVLTPEPIGWFGVHLCAGGGYGLRFMRAKEKES